MPRGVPNKKKMAKAEPKTGGSVTLLPTNSVMRQFQDLMKNIHTLAMIRTDMDPESENAKRADNEILQHCAAVRQLRQKVFGVGSWEVPPTAHAPEAEESLEAAYSA